MPFRTLTYQMNVLAAFSPDRPVRKRVAASEQVEIEVVCLDTGQFLPVHAPASDLVFLLWEGRADFRMGDQDTQVATGHIITVPAGVARGCRARSKVIALVLHAPPLTADDRAYLEQAWQARRYEPPTS